MALAAKNCESFGEIGLFSLSAELLLYPACSPLDITKSSEVDWTGLASWIPGSISMGSWRAVRFAQKVL